MADDIRKGHVKKFLRGKGYGFITQDGGGEDVYFHVNDVSPDADDIREGCPVEFVPVQGDRGPKALTLRITGPPSSRPQPSPRTRRSSGRGQLPQECIFDELLNEEGHPRQELYFDAAEKAAECFRRAKLKRSQFRQIYQGFMSFAGPLRTGELDFAAARNRFAELYTRRIIRQAKRGYVPQVVQEFFDRHRSLALSGAPQMLAFFSYLTNIMCYFGDKD